MKKVKKLLLIALTSCIILFWGCDMPVPAGSTSDPTDPANPGAPTVLDVITISGDITSDETWVDGKIYYISSNIDIEATVTIEPGCIVKFGEGKYITILTAGKIISEGTSAKPVFFTSKYSDLGGDSSDTDIIPLSSDWGGIRINSPDSSFKFCQFEYASSAVKIASPNIMVTISDCVFTNNNYGLFAGADSLPAVAIERNRFFKNYIPISMRAYLNIGDSNIFESADGTLKNTNQYIELQTMGLTANTITLTKDTVFSETELAYHSYWHFLITNSAVFTLNPGVVLKMGGGFRIVEISIDTGSEFIMGANSYVTSYYDNSRGGVSATSQAPGSSDWNGIERKSGGTYSWEKRDRVLYSIYSTL